MISWCQHLIFFKPKNVAVVGASRKPDKPGYIIIKNLLSTGVKGSIYPVNPEYREILSPRTYPTILDIPSAVDLAVINVPAGAVLNVLKSCVEKNVKAVVIISSGFAEPGDYGERPEAEIARLACKANMWVLGPNTSGILNTADNFITTFVPLSKVKRGPVAYVAQTGNFATLTLEWILTAENFGISKVIGLGNKCDVDDADALEFLEEDSETKVIAMYIKDFKDAKCLLRVAKRVTKKKPVIALKAGRHGSN